MALTVSGMKRSFTFKKGSETIKLTDPNPAEAPEEVMNYYSNLYPELTTATVHGLTIRTDEAVYEFKPTSATKG